MAFFLYKRKHKGEEVFHFMKVRITCRVRRNCSGAFNPLSLCLLLEARQSRGNQEASS